MIRRTPIHSSNADTFSASAYSAQPCFVGIPNASLAYVIEHIHSHLDQPLKVPRLANLLGMSPSHFSKLFKISLGTSPHQFVLQARVDRAKELLRGSTARIVDIAFGVGFETQAHFTTVFGTLVGMTPRQFRIASYVSSATPGSLFLIQREEQRSAGETRASSRVGRPAPNAIERLEVGNVISYDFHRRDIRRRHSVKPQF